MLKIAVKAEFIGVFNLRGIYVELSAAIKSSKCSLKINPNKYLKMCILIVVSVNLLSYICINIT